MTELHDDPLWRRIERFELDDADASLTFTRRLARENGWSLGYAKRVIGEYKKFCYLAFRSGHHVTPSDEVDQAWHLHLAYTRSYWDEFCGDVLGGPLHHGPTKGGATEGAKYRDWYQATLDSYVRVFGEAPPADIWPDAERRFRNVGGFRRIDMAGVWLVPKPSLGRWPAMAGLSTALVTLAACVEINSANIFDWLPVALGLLTVVVVIVAVMRQNWRSGRGGSGRAAAGCDGEIDLSDAIESSDSDSGGDSGCGGCGD